VLLVAELDLFVIDTITLPKPKVFIVMYNAKTNTHAKIDNDVKTNICRNPNLAKCGGEAQHLEKLGFGVLRDS
jgi:hypothetical protein